MGFLWWVVVSTSSTSGVGLGRRLGSTNGWARPAGGLDKLDQRLGSTSGWGARPAGLGRSTGGVGLDQRVGLGWRWAAS
ncbi:hypothetical protein ABW18_17735 [Gordonia jacobaea]|uniref:Secreted protein n=1 Tax=Gordonia jacobaea TaxID=122202 RepID=A0ABR5I935_9ACTN|nr:hypothetical protein ABW18_17735 [Gordonia jacobaea]